MRLASSKTKLVSSQNAPIRKLSLGRWLRLKWKLVWLPAATYSSKNRSYDEPLSWIAVIHSWIFRGSDVTSDENLQDKRIHKVFCQILVTRFSLTAACHMIILESKHSVCSMSDGKKLLNFERYGRVIDYSTTHSTTIPSSCSILRGTRSWRPLYSVWEGNYIATFAAFLIYCYIVYTL